MKGVDIGVGSGDSSGSFTLDRNTSKTRSRVHGSLTLAVVPSSCYDVVVDYDYDDDDDDDDDDDLVIVLVNLLCISRWVLNATTEQLPGRVHSSFT
ncbi:hypothetical protein M0804_001203 [Polistes exclamans]|nr:hypothetical protein M0804_001203 [Polistes exclamans]